MDVTLLTAKGARSLKTFSPEELKKFTKSSGEIGAQKLIFDESTKDLDLNDRADVDLVTLYGENRIARIPRFMIWRGFLKLYLTRDGKLFSKGQSSRMLVPSSIFEVSNIAKIELTRATLLYPETELHLRTNPAASRGEKLFIQSCLACHGFSNAPKLKIESITDTQLKAFAAKHRSLGGITLEARDLRGLEAYREALISEHSEVKSKK